MVRDIFFKKALNLLRYYIFIIVIFCASISLLHGQLNSAQQENCIIKKITIEGAHTVPPRAILAKVPYRVGDYFDAKKSGLTIRALHLLGYFQNIALATYQISDNELEVRIVVTEKPRIVTITYEGNKVISAQKLDEKLGVKNIKTLDENELKNIADQIKKLYREKNYHHTVVTGTLKQGENNSSVAHFVIKEGVGSRVKIVNFQGNTVVSDKVLRAKILSKEDWLLGFIDRSGMYHPDAILQDRYIIENYYQSNGYLTARVIDAHIDEDSYGDIQVTFVIDEGDLYTINKIEIPGNDLMHENQLLMRIPIFPGQLYSKDLIRKTMEALRMLWGEYGYVYADVQPSIRPNNRDKTVDITFTTDLGNQMYVNYINIVGNRKTKDKVVRREILFDEGDILTTRLMEESKTRLELLGFFEPRDGVQWKLTKIDENTADLDLLLQEIKTGKVFAKMGVGIQADRSSPTGSFSVEAGLNDTNFRGSGLRYSLTGNYSPEDQIFQASLSNNWFFDRPIFAGGDAYIRKTTYEDFNQTQNSPVERVKGGNVQWGFRLPQLYFLQIGMATGYERISYEQENKAIKTFNDVDLQSALQAQIDRTFQAGSFAYVSASCSQDLRNHPMFPSQGYSWLFDMKIGVPHCRDGFGFLKCNFDAHWYTPLIQEYGAILHLHGFFGYITKLHNHTIPYRELFHIGGPATVRGFTYGQIGPSMIGSSLGSTKAMTATVEIRFPISYDGNFRGMIFYNGGSGWDTPDAAKLSSTLLQNNNFDFRHAIGIGLSMMSPTPIRVDWGFKLDQKRRRNESFSEVHISMSQAF